MKADPEGCIAARSIIWGMMNGQTLELGGRLRLYRYL